MGSPTSIVLSFPGKQQIAFPEPCPFFLEGGLTDASQPGAQGPVLLTPQALLHENLLLQGDNLQSLVSLESLGASFQVIYVDPPYNSLSQQSFYDKHSPVRWLTLMWPRLQMLHKLLSEDGVLFVSIDDRQLGNLIVLLNEIFGNNNHIGTIKWRRKRKPSFLHKHLNSVIEYVLVFAKDRNHLKALRGYTGLSTQDTPNSVTPTTREHTRPVLNGGNRQGDRQIPAGARAYCADGTYQPGYYQNRSLGFELLDELVIKDGLVVQSVVVRGRFRIAQEMFAQTVFITKHLGLRRYVLPSEHTAKNATDDATQGFETNEDGHEQLKSLFTDQTTPFCYPKPVGLMTHLLGMPLFPQHTPDNPIRCLDVFAGSATLAQAVHTLNAQHGGPLYQFCCLQNQEPLSSPAPPLFTVAQVAAYRIRAVEDQFGVPSKCKIYSPKI